MPTEIEIAECITALMQAGWLTGAKVIRNLALERDGLRRENERLRMELTKVYDAIGASKVSCPKCGGQWVVPDQLHGDPRFDCPDCVSAENRTAGGTPDSAEEKPHG